MGTPHILLAEDHPTNTFLVQAILGCAGFEVTCVENGKLAVEAATRESYDLILMDVQMPVMDGHAAIREIRRAEDICGHHRCRIYTVTTNGDVKDVKASLDAGADGHIRKPFRPQDLLDAVASIVGDDLDDDRQGLASN